MDPIICCLMGLCCPPGSPEQRDVLETLLAPHFSGDDAKEKAKAVVDAMYADWTKATKKLAAAVKKAKAA